MTGIPKYSGGDAKGDRADNNQHLQRFIVLRALSHHMPCSVSPFVLFAAHRQKTKDQRRKVSFLQSQS